MQKMYNWKEKNTSKLEIIHSCQIHEQIGDTKAKFNYEMLVQKSDVSLLFNKIPNKIPQTHGNKL